MLSQAFLYLLYLYNAVSLSISGSRTNETVDFSIFHSPLLTFLTISALSNDTNSIFSVSILIAEILSSNFKTRYLSVSLLKMSPTVTLNCLPFIFFPQSIFQLPVSSQLYRAADQFQLFLLLPDVEIQISCRENCFLHSI